MKNSKKFLAFIILFASSISFGQDKKDEKSPELIARKQADKMESKYNLSKEQKESIYLLRIQEIEAIKIQKANPELDEEKVKEILKYHREKLEKILTEEQLEQIKNEREKRKKEHHEKEMEIKEYKK